MAWVIKDLSKNEYYRQRHASGGWYSLDINNARLYTSIKQAQVVIDSATHHVTYPYNRDLKIIEVRLVEV